MRFVFMSDGKEVEGAFKLVADGGYICVRDIQSTPAVNGGSVWVRLSTSAGSSDVEVKVRNEDDADYQRNRVAFKGSLKSMEIKQMRFW